MIIICKICGQYICPASCPSFEGRVAGLGMSTGECAVCEERIYADDVHFSREGKLLCEECAGALISTELLRFLELDDINDFFEMLW